jgi:TonB family protein
MKQHFFAFGLAFSLAACGTPEKKELSEMENYLRGASAKFNPILQDEISTRIKNLRERGLAVVPLNPPDNEVLISLSMTKEGEIKDVQVLKKSRYALLNKSAEAGIAKASPLSPPPSSCLKDEICTIRWKFILQ